jgi:glycolate oxidase iron-sulfur subunit
MEHSQYINDLSKCVRCGSCKALCPTFDEGASETMGARGRLRVLYALSTGQLGPSSRLNDHIFSCMLCGVCSRTCPLGIDISEVIYHARSLLRGSDKSIQSLGVLINLALKNDKISFRLFKTALAILAPLLIKKGFLTSPPEMPDAPIRSGHRIYTVQKKRGRVAVFSGCMVKCFYPNLVEILSEVLRKLGYEVVLPGGEMCCGIPMRSLGFEEEASGFARKNLKTFKQLHIEAILSLCPTCTLVMREQYPKLIGEGVENVMDISDFFINKLAPLSQTSKTRQLKSVTFHDPCHLKYGLGISEEPRKIIRNAGIEIIEAKSKGCCGFGGVFSMLNKDISKGLLSKRADTLCATGAEAIVTACPGCMFHLSQGTKKIPVMHLIEIIDLFYSDLL